MTQKNKVCCFTGHRQIANSEFPEVKMRLTITVEKLISRGVIYFGCGGAYGFDMLAGYTVLDLRKKYSKIKLIMVLPCKNQTEKWSYKDKMAYQILLDSADKIVYISEKYYNGCLQKRNRHLVINSSICVAYLVNSKSGTAQTVRFAKQYGLEIINLAE